MAIKNHFRLYDDVKGYEAATMKIKLAADALAKEVRKHGRHGALDTHSMEALCDYVWRKIRSTE